MTFMEEVIARSMPLWQQAADETFLEQMGTGTLPKQQFLEYIIQDSIYLRDYARAFAMGLFKSRTLRDMQAFYSVLGFVNASENATRLQYLADFGLTDEAVEHRVKKPACRDYTAFLLETAEKGDIPEILMAVMPCMLGYSFVFGQLLRRHPAVMATDYAPLVRDYTSDQYKASCGAWTDYCNQVCQGLDGQRKEKLARLFEQASRHELYFWRMAGEAI